MDALDEAWSFIKRYIDLDYEAQRSRYSEPDAQLGPKLGKLNALFADEMRLASAISRPANLSPAELAEQKRAHFDSVRKRHLFGVDEYAEPRFGHVYACHLSDPRADGIDERVNVYYLAKLRGDFQIVSWDRRCSECQGAGRFGDRPCPSCNGVGWRHQDGATLALGGRIKTRMPE